MSKYLIAFALLLSLSAVASSQIDGTGTISKSAGGNSAVQPMPTHMTAKVAVATVALAVSPATGVRLLVVVLATPAQVDGTDVGVYGKANGNVDDDVLTPYQMKTAQGTFTIVVHELTGWAAVSLNGINLYFAPLNSIPLPPGVREATVGSGICIWEVSGGMSPHTGPVVVIIKEVVGHGPSLTLAVKDHAQQIKEAQAAGFKVGLCGEAQG